METLTELVAKITTDASGLSKGLSDAEGKTEQSSKKMADSLKQVGMAMAASGAAITAALGLMGKAAIDEEINIKRLATTMGNVGVEYDKVRDSLEAVISATQRKTGVADDEQRDILNRLILVTGDYNKALELLPTTLDLAAAGGMDATTAATYLGKAFLELEDGAEEVSVRFGQASLKFKDMEDIQNRVRGSAENLKNPLTGIGNAMGDIAEAIGANLIPIIKSLTVWVEDISIKIQAWIKEHPELAKNITLVAAGLGILLTVVGGLILIMPTITSMVAAFGVVFHAALGPIGLISIAITALIAGGILLWRNWDTIWNAIKTAVLASASAMINGLEKFLGWIPGIGDKIRSAKDAFANMIDSKKVAKDAQEMTSVIRGELEKQKSDALSALNSKKRLAKEGFDDAVNKIKEEYGEYKTATKNRMDLAKDASDAERRALEDGLKAAQRIHNEKISLLEEEYDQKIKTLNAEADYEISQIQNEIDAIDEQTRAEDLAITRANEQKRLEELKSAIDRAETAEDLAEAKEEYEEYATEIARNELLRQRDAEKEALRDRIDDIRTQTKTQEDALREEVEAHKIALNEEYAAFEENQNKIIAGLDKALELELTRLEEEKQAKLTLEKTKLDATLNTLAKEEESINASFSARLEEAAIYQAALERTLRDVEQTVTTHYVSVYSEISGGGDIIAAQHGAIIDKPTLTLMGEQAPAIREAVIPETMWNEIGGQGNVIVQFTQPVFFDREDTMNRFVDKISKTLDRKYRLGGRSLA